MKMYFSSISYDYFLHSIDFAIFLIGERKKCHKIFIPQRIFMQITNILYLHKEKTPFEIP